jgi:membrane-bound lytic murein transglycosylase B
MILRKRNYLSKMRGMLKSISLGINYENTISFVIGILFLAILALIVASAKAQNTEIYVSKLVFDTSHPLALNIESEKAEIVPGESTVQREAREKAEAEARERAEAKARADALNTSKVIKTSAKTVVYNDPSDFDALYAKAEAQTGVDRRILRAVHYVETGCSGSTSKRSYAGAQGPMQFLPSTWKRHGVDGNGDGVADINNVEDAVLSAAYYLKACGYPNVQKALWGYNPSQAYYNKVMKVARSLGYPG